VTPELDAAIAYEVADKAIPSVSYAIFDRRHVLAQGHAVAAGAPPLAGDALFRLGSISKTYCALAAMRLVEQGRLDLDADIGGALGGLRPRDPFHDVPVPLTLRKLLGHRSGLTREAAIGNYLDSSEPPLAATIESLRGTRYKVDPSGHVYRYSNAGFAVVGAAIEAASGESYGAHLVRHVLAPLGLADTHVQLAAAQRRRLAPARMWADGRDFPAPVFNMGSAPAGNLAATLGDVARYGQMLLGGGAPLLRPDTLAAMWTVPDGGPAGYGLGFAVGMLGGQRCVGHGGVLYGYASQLLVLPEAGIGVVMVSTRDATNDAVDRLARYALRLVLADRDGSARPAAPRRLPLPDPAVSRAWVGTYAADDGSGLSLISSDGRLLLVHDTVPLELRPLDAGRLVLDGRLYGEGTSYAHATVALGDAGTLGWRGRIWRRVAGPAAPVPPPDLAPHLGGYGPDCIASRLLWAGRLVCVMELFFPHDCVPLGGTRYRLGPGMYEDEIVELGVRDAAGRPAMRVGDMLLARER